VLSQAFHPFGRSRSRLGERCGAGAICQASLCLSDQLTLTAPVGFQRLCPHRAYCCVIDQLQRAREIRRRGVPHDNPIVAALEAIQDSAPGNDYYYRDSLRRGSLTPCSFIGHSGHHHTGSCMGRHRCPGDERRVKECPIHQRCCDMTAERPLNTTTDPMIILPTPSLLQKKMTATEQN